VVELRAQIDLLHAQHESNDDLQREAFSETLRSLEIQLANAEHAQQQIVESEMATKQQLEAAQNQIHVLQSQLVSAQATASQRVEQAEMESEKAKAEAKAAAASLAAAQVRCVTV